MVVIFSKFCRSGWVGNGFTNLTYLSDLERGEVTRIIDLHELGSFCVLCPVSV